MRLHCFFTVNSSVNAAGDHLAGGSFMEKGSYPTELFISSFFFFFPFFCVVVFYM